MKINSLLEKLVNDYGAAGVRPANSVTVQEYATLAKICRKTANEHLVAKFRSGELDRALVREAGEKPKYFYFAPVKKPHRRE